MTAKQGKANLEFLLVKAELKENSWRLASAPHAPVSPVLHAKRSVGTDPNAARVEGEQDQRGQTLAVVVFCVRAARFCKMRALVCGVDMGVREMIQCVSVKTKNRLKLVFADTKRI